MRIALISDIHFGAMSTTTELAVHGEPLQIGEVQKASPLFQGLINVLKKEKPEYLFIAGDLTSSGSPLEFKYCYQKMHQLGSEVGIKPANMVFCLGNHDIDWRISELVDSYTLKPGATYLSDDIAYLKSNYCRLAYSWPVQTSDPISQKYSSKYSTPLTGVIEHDDCVIFILNSGHLCTHDQEHKHGCLSDLQLEWFKEVVQQYNQTTKVKIVLLHHHPFNYPYPLTGLDISTLEEGSELLQLCGEKGVDLVLHGHRHHPKAQTIFHTGWVKPVTYVCSGSLSVNASHRLQGSIPNTFHIIEYKNYDQIILSNYSYKPATGWSLTLNNCPETPIDGKMRLGKIIDDETAIKHIRDLPKNQPIKYQSLSDDLMYLSLKKLNELVVSVHGKDNEIFNDFPKDVIIYSHREV